MVKPSAPVVEGSIAQRLSITSAAIFEALRMREKFDRGFTLREDDNLG